MKLQLEQERIVLVLAIALFVVFNVKDTTRKASADPA